MLFAFLKLVYAEKVAEKAFVSGYYCQCYDEGFD